MLVAHADGNLYGTTASGAQGGAGAIFRIRFGPTPVTGDATGITGVRAQLEGSINPNGANSTWWFEYRQLGGSFIQTAPETLTSSEGVSKAVTNLTTFTTYEYRIASTNIDANQVQRGEIRSFRTGTASPNLVVETVDGTRLANGSASVDFGSISLGEVTRRVLKLRNTGAATLNLSFISGFSSAFYPPAYPPPTLAPGGEYLLNIDFNPTAVGNHATTVLIESDDGANPQFRVDLSGWLRSSFNPRFTSQADPILRAPLEMDLSGIGLDTLEFSFVPKLGETFVLIYNPWIEPVNGTFAGLGEGSLVSAKVGVETYFFRINYADGYLNKSVRLRRVPAPGQVASYDWKNFAGSPGNPGTQDGLGSAAGFQEPEGIAVDPDGNTYVADTLNHVIRKISVTGQVSTFAGTAGLRGSADGAGPVARFTFPYGLAYDRGRGWLYVADLGNSTIRMIDYFGNVSTVAGLAGIPGSANGAGSAARFNSPNGLAVDADRNLYVADRGNHTIRKIDLNGLVTTVAGLAGISGSTNGGAGIARFNSPRGVAVDASGRIYVTDSGNQAIRKILTDGTVSTLAGQVGSSGGTDGTGTAARFNNPGGIAVDPDGDLWVADSYGSTVRRITPTGKVTTEGGLYGMTGSADGLSSSARFFQPVAIASRKEGTLVVADLCDDN